MITKNCLVCNKELKTYPSKLLGGKGKYCSKVCCLSVTNKILEENGRKTRIQPIIGLDNYRGGIRKDGKGYHFLRKKIREHRKVVSDFIGRQINRKEVVHHIDENKLNNNLSNLVLFKHTNAHTRFHLFIKRHNLNGNLFSCLSIERIGDAL